MKQESGVRSQESGVVKYEKIRCASTIGGLPRCSELLSGRGARQLQLDVSDSYNSRFCGRL